MAKFNVTISADDFGLTEIENSLINKYVPTQIKINDEIIATLVKCELIEKSMLKVVYNYIVPNPINFIHIDFTTEI